MSSLTNPREMAGARVYTEHIGGEPIIRIDLGDGPRGFTVRASMLLIELVSAEMFESTEGLVP